MLSLSVFGQAASDVAVEQQPKKLKLYSYWRSSCSFRVRIALNLKGLLLLLLLIF
jgi:hypothetical protein